LQLSKQKLALPYELAYPVDTQPNIFVDVANIESVAFHRFDSVWFGWVGIDLAKACLPPESRQVIFNPVLNFPRL
jgi:hypothetical protein